MDSADTITERSTVDYVEEKLIDNETQWIRHGAGDGPGRLMARYTLGVLHIYPAPGEDVHGVPDYDIEEIRVELTHKPELEEGLRDGWLLTGPPRGIGTVFQYGMYFPKRFRCLASAIRECGCTVLSLTKDSIAERRGNEFRMPISDFEAATSEIDLHISRSQAILTRLRENVAANVTRRALGQDSIDPMRGRKREIQAMTDAITGKKRLTEDEEADLINLLTEGAAEAVARNPKTIGRLMNDLDLVSLDQLIKNYSSALENPQTANNERIWQRFFTENPFAIQQLFGVPTLPVSDKQLQVKRPRSDGTGAVITDFLFVNPLTLEGTIIEIKHPQSPLIDPTPYRGKGSSEVLRANKELIGGVAQLTVQRNALRATLSSRLEPDDPLQGVERAQMNAVLIAGRVDQLDPTHREAFLNYRDGLRDITVLGFDEVLKRIEQLRNVLIAREI